MKKLSSILSAFAVVVPFVGISLAGDSVSEFLNYVLTAEDPQFGYSSNDKLTFDNWGTNTLNVSSPIIKDDTNGNVGAYIFFASTETALNNPVAYWCFDDVDTSRNSFSVALDVSNLDANSTYYLYAYPVADLSRGAYDGKCSATDVQNLQNNGTWGKGSTENGLDPCFLVGEKFYGQGDACKNHTSSPIYSMRNVDHTFDGTYLTLTWQSVSNDKVDIYVLIDNNEEKFLASVSMGANTYKYKVERSGDYVFEFRPTDGSQSIDYTAHYIELPTNHVTPVTPVKPIVVGPKENILAIIIGTLFLYIVYRIVRRKAD